MKVTTLTLNPAIDQTVLCSPFDLAVVNRAQATRIEAGGKGVNVATFLAQSGCPTIATGFMGDENTAVFEAWFAQHAIEDRFVRIAGCTRTGIKVVDQQGQHTTDINLPGLCPDEADIERLLRALPTLAQASDWVALCGSLPPGLPDDFYARLIPRLRDLGCQTLLDSSGEALAAGLLAGPAIVKPNLAELEELVGARFDPQDCGAIAAAARGILGNGVALVVVSLGQWGALFVQPEHALRALPPAITVRSTVGAGDALVAGLISAKRAGLPLPACARRAVAFSAALVSAERRALPAWPDLERLAHQVVITPI